MNIYWTEETTGYASNGRENCAAKGLRVSEYRHRTTPAAAQEACEALAVPGAGMASGDTKKCLHV